MRDTQGNLYLFIRYIPFNIFLVIEYCDSRIKSEYALENSKMRKKIMTHSVKVKVKGRSNVIVLQCIHKRL